MGKFIDLSNQTYGNWQVLSLHDKGANKESLWNCRCLLCGSVHVVQGRTLRDGRSTKCRSCGTRIGKAKSYSYDPIKRIYCGMKQRCYNPNSRSFKNYGDRGISICDQWLENPSSFYEWAYSHGYKNGMSIERIDVDKGYSPDNCTFIPKSEQSKNRRMSFMITIDGKTLCLADWCRIYNINSSTVTVRHKKKGMPWEEALSTPVDKSYARR